MKMTNIKKTKLSDLAYSVLDLAPIPKGGTAADAYKRTVDLAQHVEKWGYTRYWLAEHHNNPGVASSATSILIGHVAGHTSHIRVGSGGIMLPNHAPLVIAEQFGTLESLYPGRIDLGLGRAPGTDGLTAYALRRDRNSDGQDFPEQLSELRSYFSSDIQKVNAIPGQGLDPSIWLLGSSGYSAQLAGYLGLPFAFASHFSAENTLAALALYRNHFQPSNVLSEPYAIVGANVIAADTDEEAQKLATSLQQYKLQLIRNQRDKLQPPVDHIDDIVSGYEKAILQQKMAGSIIGGPATVKRQLEKFLAETQADEIMVTGQIYDHQARLRSFEIIADLLRG
jgi:luciferase family oxidoreductase group 1